LKQHLLAQISPALASSLFQTTPPPKPPAAAARLLHPFPGGT
jgi:hypothetical protein